MKKKKTPLNAAALAPQAAYEPQAGDFERVERNLDEFVDENFSGQSYLREMFHSLFKNKGAAVSLVLIALIVLMAIFAPMFSPYSYRDVNDEATNLPMRIPLLEDIGIFDGTRNGVDMYEAAGVKDEYHYFGTDSLGRDSWTRVWEGTRISLLISLLAVVLDVVVGVTYGLISGYFGGKVDMVMQRIVEVLMGIPNLIIMTLLLLVMEPGILTICLALMITGWINMSRIVRAQVLRLKNNEYVLASRTQGAKALRIIFKDILPNTLGQIIITFMFSVPNAIFFEAFLAFIGLGVPIPMASLGTLINDGYKSALLYPSQVLLPILVLSVLMLSFNLLADGLRDAIDPQMRNV